MATLTNPKPIIDVVETMPMLQNKLNESTEAMTLYVKYLKDEKFIRQENETKEEALLRAEGTLERLDEIVERRKILMNSAQEVMKTIDEMKEKMEIINRRCEDDEDNLADANNEIIDEIIKLYDAVMEEKIAPHQVKIDEYRQEYEENKKRVMESRMEPSAEKKARLKREQEERERREKEEKFKPMMLSVEEGEQLESWTSKKCHEVVFDSDKDNWSVGTSVFDSKVMNRSNLAFVVEDTEGNKFGGYVNAKIDKVGPWINDPNAFVFSLKSNGRINGMMKFDITEQQYAFLLYNNSNDYFFVMGGGYDIRVDKKGKSSSYCKQRSFNYQGISNALCGPNTNFNYFTPKRITVIQMVSPNQ